jgi:dTDP-4-dehydrorhamnose 3,5-epimerase-like enzyme
MTTSATLHFRIRKASDTNDDGRGRNKRAASLDPKNDEILIPPGVGHGYKALGIEPVQLLYFSDRHYNPADE